MSLWGSVDNDASEPKNLATGEFQGTAGKAIYGVDDTEQQVANAASGNARKYAAPHAGWVAVNTYTDMHGNARVKTETLVAMNIQSGDQADDAKYADS
tara:strand:+ start:117 stop:410 length:294 start_codon:yes stop_codon:yes gene_type:complete